MAFISRHILSQTAVIGGIVKLVWQSKKNKGKNGDFQKGNGQEFNETVSPRANTLINDYIKHTGGNISFYRGIIPFHFFPQWSFPIMSKTLENLPFNLLKVINGGCKITINHQIPRGVPLHLRAQLTDLDANEKRVIMVQRLITETEETPEACIVEQTVFIPLSKKHINDRESKKKKIKEKARVSLNAREVGKFRVHKRSGLEFALLTGDINPLHWFPLYARGAGFKSSILHGFSSLARTIEILNRNVFSGDVSALKEISIKFTKPVPLPGEARVFIDNEGGLFTGVAPGGPVFLMGTYQTK